MISRSIVCLLSILIQASLLADLKKNPVWRRYIKSTHHNPELKGKPNIQSAMNRSVRVAHEPCITIWIHGTCIPFGVRFYHAPDLGIWAAKQLGSHHLSNVANKLAEINPTRFSVENFYCFGWSGKLSFEERDREAQNLYECTKKVVNDFVSKHHVKPKIRYITHSHGGNVALKVAHKAQLAEDNEFSIDELVLLACPVQSVTEEYVHYPCFKKVYNIFSKDDYIQRMDPQGLYKATKESFKTGKKKKTKYLFSRRKFKSDPKIIQAYVRVNERSLMHIEFIMSHVVKFLPTILDDLDRCFEKRNKHDLSPKIVYSLHINS